MGNNQVQTVVPKTRRRTESPKNHYFTFVISILLTMFAFAAVLYGGLPEAFLVPFLIIMGIVQVVFQLAYWMHMKDRGHLFAIIGLSFGAIITVAAVITVIFWVWW